MYFQIQILSFNCLLRLLNLSLPKACKVMYFGVCVSPQVQTLVEQEVRAAMKSKERKLQDLLEKFEKMDNEVNYASSIQKLEVGGSSGSHLLLTENVPAHCQLVLSPPLNLQT